MTGAADSRGLPEDLTAALRRALAEHYTLHEEIGHGSSAVVFRATDVRLRREVAIKVLRPEVVAAAGSPRFEREIDTVAALSHPHVVALYDSGSAAGVLYYVMPLVEGESLRERLRRERQLPLDEALRIARDIASALQYAHDHGLVHRDVKPENILITGSSASALADFGLARVRLHQADGSLTLSGVAVGTAAYMSPEQAVGDAVDGRSDQYALACVLFEMLAGVPPFHAATSQGMLARHRGDPAPRIRHVRDSVPHGIEEALLRAMAKLPADRFASVAEFVRALEGALTRETLASVVGPRSDPALAAGRFGANASTRRIALWSAGVAILAFVAVKGGAVLGRPSPGAGTDSSLVAVAPFDVFDSRDEVWRTGMVDLLTRRFDGAGPLRTVSASEVLRVFRGRADASSAVGLGVATKAGLVVFGQVLRAGRDSLRLTGVLFDLRDPKALIEVDVRDREDAFDRMSDSLTVALLRELGRRRALAATPRATLGTGSLPALKLFLQAEQARRNNAYGRALRLYDGAIAADSSFALAYRGAARSLAITNETDPLAMWYARRAGERNRRLATTDSLLLLADSLVAVLPVGPGIWDVGAVRNLRRRISALQEAARLKAGDPEIWTQLAEAYIHFGYRVGVTAEQTLQTFERAIAADPGYAPAYFHTLELSMGLRSVGATRDVAERFLRASPNDARFRAVLSLLSDSAESVARGRALMQRLPADSLLSVAYLFRRWYGENDFAAEAYRELLLPRAAGTDDDSLSAHGWLVIHLLHRGRMREAGVLTGSAAKNETPLFLVLMAEHGFPGGAAMDSAATRWAASGSSSAGIAAARWFAFRRDSAALRRLARDPRSEGIAAGFATALLTVSGPSRDSTLALRQSRRLPDSVCSWMCWPVARLTSQLLVAADSAREAARFLDRFPPAITSTNPVEGEWLLERARVSRIVGDTSRERALRQRLGRIWLDADSAIRAELTRALPPRS